MPPTARAVMDRAGNLRWEVPVGAVQIGPAPGFPAPHHVYVRTRFGAMDLGVTAEPRRIMNDLGRAAVCRWILLVTPDNEPGGTTIELESFFVVRVGVPRDRSHRAHCALSAKPV